MRRRAQPTPATAPPYETVSAGQREGGHKLWLKDTARHLDLHAGMSYRESCLSKQIPSGIGVGSPLRPCGARQRTAGENFRRRSPAPKRGFRLFRDCDWTPVSENRYSDVLFARSTQRALASHRQRQHLRVVSEVAHEVGPTHMDGQNVSDVLRYR